MSAIPEVEAASRIASLLDKHQDPRWLTPACLQYVSSKVVGHRHAVAAIFDELEADPRRLRDRDVVLRGQQVAGDLDDPDHFLEQLAYHEHAAEECRAVLRSMPVHRDLYDPDAVAADREDARERERRQDEAAREAAPKVAS